MRFPKSNKIISFYLIVFSSLSVFGQDGLLKVNDSTLSCTFDNKALNRLVKNDSLYKATLLLNDAISFSGKYNLKSTQAKAYYSLGKVLTKMSNYKNAESYHLKAYDIYQSINDSLGENLVLSGLVNTYLSSKNYSKFDSIYPKAQQVSKRLNTELYFVNLDFLIKKSYYSRLNDELLEQTEFAIDAIKNIDFDSLNFSEDKEKEGLKNKLLYSYKFNNAIAHVKSSAYKAESYKRLFSIDEEKLKLAFEDDFDAFRKLGTFNYYKYLYYSDVKKNLDSANLFLLKSDSYKYNALGDFEKRNARNGELIYKIINTQQKLDLANEIRKKDAKTSKAMLIIAIFTTFLLIITLAIFYFYIKAKRNSQAVNEALKASNEKLVAIDKDRQEFFSILSHELRTPVYGITGLATLVEQETDKNKQQSYLESLISSSNYLSILVDNILQANRLRFEEKNLRLKPDKIENIINHVISTIKVSAKDKGLKLITHIDPSNENEHILIDKVAFSQILINLVYNAIRYTQKGQVSINVFEKARSEKDVTLKFEVNDTGIGIKEEHREIVFNAFENKTFLHKNSSGSGLGLSIVKTLLKSHNSDIDFVSESGKGSSFFFEIKFNIALSLKLKKPIAIDSNLNNMHVLIVDDNKINLLITKKNIEKINGYTCETTSNGRLAISMVRARAFDLILMDINMPGMDGFEVTKHIRMFNSKIPILALTALNSNEISLKAKEIGINQIITKPYIFDDFKAIILSHNNGNENYYKQPMAVETM
ncbi:response regulator [Winogradskyella echinorum]|uniref:histidine kinase n=1 Tax=Winogradskyella echinorum TaxID=538189 RepID=A0ABR6XXT6_9FLAO|nr:response regulator [Winogradskyella echinorum]MBC3845318.1 response regulator [Winogradskyella echinorum]MBC5749666.1 response regulator [Winogradskyella echinorum]